MDFLNNDSSYDRCHDASLLKHDSRAVGSMNQQCEKCPFSVQIANANPFLRSWHDMSYPRIVFGWKVNSQPLSPLRAIQEALGILFTAISSLFP